MRVSLSQMRRQQGSATVELIVGCLAAIPLFFGISLLGKYADMRHKTVEAARYVAWENVIWQGSKSQADYQLEATDRLLGQRSASVVDRSVLEQEGVSEDPLWRDQSTRTLMVNDGSTVRVNVAQSNVGSTNHSILVGPVAGQMDLDRSMVRKFDVTMPFTNRLRQPKANEATNLRNFFNPSHYVDPQVLDFNASAAILTDAWDAKNSGDYKSRIKKLTVEDELDLLVMFGTQTFGYFFPYDEGKYGANPDIVASAESVLQEYKP